MWVSQTYLTNLNADGSVAAYYLFEAYRDDHKRLERLIRPKLALLARSFGDSVHLFVPAEEDRGAIEKEFNDWMHRKGLHGIEFPGILILTRSMNDEKSYDGSAIFISLSSLLEREEDADALLGEVQLACQKVADEIRANKGGLERVLENLQLKPAIWGMGYDLKPRLMKIVKGLKQHR